MVAVALRGPSRRRRGGILCRAAVVAACGALLARTLVAAFVAPPFRAAAPAPSSARNLQCSEVLERRAVGAKDEGVEEGLAVKAIRRYFDAWNARDMDTACALFAESCEYEDTLYPGAFKGKEALKTHLFKVADAVPPSFEFCIDDIADGGNVVGVQWHVESNGQVLPFTRGCSMYRADPDTGLLLSGFDVPEPAPIKSGSASLTLLTYSTRLISEPIRAIPLIVWILYVVIVFFSNGILPGPDATRLDGATWEEVRDLSLNFWLISPLLSLPFAPVIHPGLEGVFNLLLAWAALFVGFLSDGRPGRTSGSMVPTIVGMQFLTNAIYLPYLVGRSPESNTPQSSFAGNTGSEGGDAPTIYYEDLDPTEASVSENRLLGPVLFVVGAIAVWWGFFGRPEFGAFDARSASLVTLLSGDRLGSSFVVDLVLFAFFQGWLVDDDLNRRVRSSGTDEASVQWLRLVAKFVPFVGLCLYMLLRPGYPNRPAAASGGGV